MCAMESGVQIYNVEPLAEKGRIGEFHHNAMVSNSS